MNAPIVTSGESSVEKNHAEAHPQRKGLIAFCETNLRYEKGFKAWVFLGPYLFGALALEMMIVQPGNPAPSLGPWIGFVAYLTLFPPIWRRILKALTSKNTPSFVKTAASAIGSR